MSVARQAPLFVGVGVLQWLTDWGVMVALSHLGAAIAFANVSGRIAGASLGFWMNGSVTFGRPGTRGPRRRHFARYVVLWLASALLSTAGVALIDAVFGRHAAWLGKPLLDGVLGLGSFLVSRYWVYA